MGEKEKPPAKPEDTYFSPDFKAKVSLRVR